MKKVFYAYLLFFLIGVPMLPARAFTVTVQQVSPQVYELGFPGQTDSYFQVYSAEELTSQWSVVGMGFNVDAPMVWTNDTFMTSPETHRFYRIRQVALTNPLDVDSDGMDDLYEMTWDFLDPLNVADAQQDYDNDGLYNYGEYVYHSSPIEKDTDKDWAIDGYEVYMGTQPVNSLSTPTLEFRINGNALYTSDTNVSLVFGGLWADRVILADSISMAQAETNQFGSPVPYRFDSSENAWRTIYAHLLRTNDSAQSPLITAGIILDTMPPLLSISSPTNGQITDRSWIPLVGTVSDSASTANILVNGTRADQETSRGFVQEKVFLSQGANTITVKAIDQAGNAATQQVTVVLDTSADTTPPSIHLDLPRDFTVTGGVTNWLSQTTVGNTDVLRLNGSTDDETATIEFYVIHPLGTNGPFMGTLFGTQLVGEVMLGFGTNTLQAIATDAAGNQTVESYILQADYAFDFEITNPAPGQLISASQMVVSGRASLSFTNAVLSVNGVAATITAVTNDEVQFTTTAPVAIGSGITALQAQALLDGRSYSVQASAFRYEYLSWHRDYSNYYSSLYWDGLWYHATVEGWWSRDDSWRSDTVELTEHHKQNVTSCDYIMGVPDCHADIRDETVTTANSPPVTYGYFGTENVRYDYKSSGKAAWDHDTIRLNDELTFVRHAPPEYAHSPVCLQFENMSYYRPPGIDVVASQITFNGRSGFMCNGNISFVVPMPANGTNILSEANFTWPSFQYIGARTVRKDFYKAETISKVHMLLFSGFYSDPVYMTFKQTAEGSYGYGSYRVASVREIQTDQTKTYMGFAFPVGTLRDENSWVASIKPAIPSDARLYIQRHGVTNPLAWSGTPVSLHFVDGELDCPVRMLQGSGLSPVASENNGTIEIANLKSRDSVVVEHVLTGVRSEIRVVENFGWEQAQTLGLDHITFLPELAGLSPLIRSNVINTLTYALDQTPGCLQALDREAMELLHAPLAAENAPSALGIGAFAPDLFHLHICFTGTVPDSARQLRDTYVAQENANRAGLYNGSEKFSIKAVRDSIAQLCRLSQPALITFLNELAALPGIVFLYHSYEWVDDGYGGIDPEFAANDPIRNLLTNLSAADTGFYGDLNRPHLIYPGTTSNDAYQNFNISELIALKFYINENGQIQLFAAPQGTYYGSIAAMQLHDLLGE